MICSCVSPGEVTGKSRNSMPCRWEASAPRWPDAWRRCACGGAGPRNLYQNADDEHLQGGQGRGAGSSRGGVIMADVTGPHRDPSLSAPEMREILWALE